MSSEFSEDFRKAFTQIHADELLEIKKRREKQSYDHTEIDATQPDLVGLALSGGGIRSATFCLGFLQELHRLRLLRIFDYLSTVSGGGYLGGWWSAWLSRQQEDTDQPPAFKPDPEHIHDPVGLLRRSVESVNAGALDFGDHLRSSARGQNLLSALERPNIAQQTSLLYEPLAEELNAYINLGATPEKRWERKTCLVDAFPCELRDIFPPREEIEPERESIADLSARGSEGSRCAWKDPIHHLRLFANYLTPRKGILSADTWRAISAVSRNLLLTWLILLPLLGGVMLLGQAYFFLNPATQEAFRCVGAECTTTAKLQPVLVALVKPLAVLLCAIVAMSIAWLLCNRDNSAPLDWIIQTACLIALVALIVAAVVAIPALRVGIDNYLQLPETLSYLIPGPWNDAKPELAMSIRRLRFVAASLVLLLTSIVIMWRWGLGNRKFPEANPTPEALSSWRREARRSRFGQAQSKLLVTMAVVAVVLLLSWVSCLVTRDLLTASDWTSLGIKLPVALLPILSAIAGSIFTAMRSTPEPTDDQQQPKSPSWFSRFVFAATPPLVVSVLAVAASAIVHQLLIKLSNPASIDQILPLLIVAAILSIALCVGLAIYELEGIQLPEDRLRSIPYGAFIILAMINVMWLVQASLRYWNTNPGALRTLLPVSAVLAVIITAVLFGKFVRAQKVKNDSPVTSLKKRLGVAALLFLGLTTVGAMIGVLMYLKTGNKDALDAAAEIVGRISRAIVLSLIALAGGVILFRVLVNRMKAEKKNHFDVRVLSNKTVSARPEALWLTASVCLTLPIAMIGAGHYLSGLGGTLDLGLQKTPESGKEALTFFPVFVGAMLLMMMFLRSLVIQKGLNAGQIPPVSGGISGWLVKVVDKRVKNEKRWQLMALAAICFITLLDTAIRGFYPGELAANLVATPVNWTVMAVGFFVSLPLFGVSVLQIPPPFEPKDYEKYRFKKQPRPWMYSPKFLWFLATICIVLAAFAGLQLPKWLDHVAHIPLSTGLTPILLPVAAACFLFVLFEFYWGERDNLRSLLLAGFAYLVVTAIFFLKLSGAGANWHLVFGLLAAICVWVGALGWMVDPNAVSMHQFYKGRLVRAYLGASNMLRYKLGNKEITETVAGDDLPLMSLINCDRGGPYHVINTTLNLSAGRDLATAQRSASSFVLSQKYCGSSRTKYCLTDEYMNGQLTLGTAVAASGAAVSPSMGAKKPTSALAMLLTLLNVRLGYWAPTPNKKGWNSSQPRLWPFYLVKEFLSQTNDLSDYCYLTDGGHFDNTGLYSLIERGCRFVVLVDCGADPRPPRFEDLGEAIRRCRIDFDTEIDLKLDVFRGGQSPTPTSCFAVGKIRFSEKHLRMLALAGNGKGYGPQRDEFKREGIIVYVKPSVIPKATADVRGYGFENKFFPQQPTTNQWFGEAQFESYRRLGVTCAKDVFRDVSSKELENRGHISLKKIQRMFFGLHISQRLKAKR